MNQRITIRMGAAYHDITVGLTNGPLQIDLSVADKTQRYEARRGLIEGLKANGYFGKKEQRNAIYRSRRAA